MLSWHEVIFTFFFDSLILIPSLVLPVQYICWYHKHVIPAPSMHCCRYAASMKLPCWHNFRQMWTYYALHNEEHQYCEKRVHCSGRISAFITVTNTALVLIKGFQQLHQHKRRRLADYRIKDDHRWDFTLALTVGSDVDIKRPLCN